MYVDAGSWTFCLAGARHHRTNSSTDCPLCDPNCRGAAMKIAVNNELHLSEFRFQDKDALIAHLNDRDIHDRTLRIPFPIRERR